MKRAALAVLLGACSAGDSDWTGTSEKMASGGTRVSNPAQGIWARDAAWQLTPDVVIGTTDGAEESTFTAITGLEVDEDGRIYVLDRQANQLRIFAPDGSHLQSVGRTGEGPGEFRAANGMRWIAPDSLVVVDQRGDRYTILTRDGTFVRSVVRTLGFFGWAFTGGYEAGKIYERSAVRTQGGLRPILLGTPLAGPNGAAAVASRDSARSRLSVDTVYLPNPTGPYFESFSIQTARGGMVMGVPFTPAPHYYLDGKGGIWHGHGSTFRIARSSFAGDTLMEIVLSGEPAPVSAQEIEEWKSTPAVARFTQMGGQLDLGRIPKVKPFLDDLVTDAQGYLWVSLPAGPRDIAFAVVDSAGRYLGRLQASGMKRDVFVPPVVRNNKLYVVGRDELDVPRVYVFRIERG
jgi:hypothetical protein